MAEVTDAQKAVVAEWIRDGAGLSEVQRRIKDEFDLTLTYMDVRFLVIELGLDVKEKETAAPAVSDPLDAPDNAAAPGFEEEGVPGGGEPEGFPGSEEPGGFPGGGVSVELDRVVKPGAIVSGSVTFSDGQTAAWTLDQLGRLGLDPGLEGYSPSPEDIQMFQDKLREALEKRGF